MEVHEIGVDGTLLKSIEKGEKTVETRLNKNRFKDIEVGDHIQFRLDTWKNGSIIKMEPTDVEAEIIAVTEYPNFRALFDAIDYKKVLPQAKSAEEAIEKYSGLYNERQQKPSGVLAIEFKLLK